MIFTICYFLVGVLATYIHALIAQEVYPDIYFIHNTERGIHAYNYFSLSNYEFRFNAMFIDGHQLPKCDIVDEEHNALALEKLKQYDEYVETYLRTYKFPVLAEGAHTLVIAFCDERQENGNARAVAQIVIDIICEPMQLLFFPGKQPNMCRFISDTSRLLNRDQWIGGDVNISQ